MKLSSPSRATLFSKKAISETLFRLLQKKPYEDITITELCKQADVVRKTFYNNFDSKDDVLFFIMDDIFLELKPYIDKPFMYAGDILLYVFKFIEVHKKDLLLFYERGLFNFARSSIVKYVTKERFLMHSEQAEANLSGFDYTAACISATIASVIETWIKNSFKESVEFLAEFTERFLYKKL